MPIKIDYEKCCWKNGTCTSCQCGGACNGCVEVCPTEALVREDIIKFNPDECSDCKACIAACKYGAISFVE